MNAHLVLSVKRIITRRRTEIEQMRNAGKPDSFDVQLSIAGRGVELPRDKLKDFLAELIEKANQEIRDCETTIADLGFRETHDDGSDASDWWRTSVQTLEDCRQAAGLPPIETPIAGMGERA